MSKLWSQIRRALRPSPDGIVTFTIGGWIGTGIWAAVLWGRNAPLGSVLGYIITVAVCMYGAMVIAFVKQKALHRRQYEDAGWRLKTAKSEIDAAEARRAFAERLLEASEDRVRTLEAQLNVMKKRRTSRRYYPPAARPNNRSQRASDYTR